MTGERWGCKVAPVEPAGTCPAMYELEAQWVQRPVDDRASHDVITECLRSSARSRRARERVHRPDVPGTLTCQRRGGYLRAHLGQRFASTATVAEGRLTHQDP